MPFQTQANRVLAERTTAMKELRHVLSRDGELRGEVRSKSRRCQMEGCRGIRIGGSVGQTAV